MLLIKPSAKIDAPICVADQLMTIERAARTCYKSEGKMNDDLTPNLEFIGKLLNNYKHESVFEHSHLTVRFIVDRGVSHELVRHRIASFSQESTRYCRYAGDVVFIEPHWFKEAPGHNEARFLSFLGLAEETYHSMLQSGLTPQDARAVLPNATKTEIVVTANFREWRHIMKLRTAAPAHPEMRRVMIPLLAKFREQIPVIFDW